MESLSISLSDSNKLQDRLWQVVSVFSENCLKYHNGLLKFLHCLRLFDGYSKLGYFFLHCCIDFVLGVGNFCLNFAYFRRDFGIFRLDLGDFLKRRGLVILQGVLLHLRMVSSVQEAKTLRK